MEDKAFVINILGGNSLPPTTVIAGIVFNKYFVLKQLGVRSITVEELNSILEILKPELQQAALNAEQATMISINISTDGNKQYVSSKTVIPLKSVFNSIPISNKDNIARIIITEVSQNCLDLLLQQ